jgi:hypothetical protein
MAMSSLTYSVFICEIFLSADFHLELRAGLSDTILKGTHPEETIPARFGLAWFSGFRGEDLISLIKITFTCSYIARSSLTYIPGFSVKFFFQPIYTDYAN